MNRKFYNNLPYKLNTLILCSNTCNITFLNLPYNFKTVIMHQPVRWQIYNLSYSKRECIMLDLIDVPINIKSKLPYKYKCNN